MADYQNALVTGASSGLGFELALRFAKRGVRVYAAARRADKLAELAKLDPNIVPVTLDVSDGAATYQKVGELDRASGGLDLVIANAGVADATRVKKLDYPAIERVLLTNVLGAAATLTGALTGMLGRKRGHLVGMGSLAGLRGMPKFAAYSGSKAFLRTFMESLRIDLRGSGVDVTCLQPGFIRTPLNAAGPKRPFMLQLEPAIDLMVRAIDRRAKSYEFPGTLATLLSMLDAVPLGMSDAAMKKFG